MLPLGVVFVRNIRREEYPGAGRDLNTRPVQYQCSAAPGAVEYLGDGQPLRAYHVILSHPLPHVAQKERKVLFAPDYREIAEFQK